MARLGSAGSDINEFIAIVLYFVCAINPFYREREKRKSWHKEQINLSGVVYSLLISFEYKTQRQQRQQQQQKAL